MIRTQRADTPPKPSKPFTSAALAYQEGYRDGQRDTGTTSKESDT